MSLSDALRAAALERARRSGHTVDGVVIEPTGVIDLREMARSAGRESDHTVKLPVIAGHLNRPERAPETPLTETALWRRLRPASSSAAEPTADESIVDLTVDELEALFDEPGSGDDGATVGVEVVGLDAPSPDADDVSPIDATLADEAGRPVAVCDACGSFGQRDLFDRISRTGYFSCDDCGYMWRQVADD